MVRTRSEDCYWLEGQMHLASYEAIENCLWSVPASNQQLMILALEESRRPKHLGGDRSEVYRLLEQYKQ